MVAALYVETNGAYFGLPDVDPWDEARDARLYDGPWPVVAHPPCKAWSIMGQCRPEIRRGQDGGTFAAALSAVRRFGGVLEHPAHSHAWPRFYLPRPAISGWTRSLMDRGWTCQIDQAHYGHPANKRTWLYYVGPAPPPLRWGAAPLTGRTVRSDGGGGRDQRSKTPLAFRDVLLALASVGAPAATGGESSVADSPAPAAEAAISQQLCAACGHPRERHSNGGMCAGESDGDECYCVRFPDAPDFARTANSQPLPNRKDPA